MALALFSLSLSTVELTDDTFDDGVFGSGKSVFVKFFAPWCGHCKALKPAWDALAAKYEASSKVMIADVDCTGAGEELCQRFGVEGFPTLKYFNPPDEEGEDYEGERDEDTLDAFIQTLGPGCSVDTLENCTAEQRVEMEAAMAMDPAVRASELAALSEELQKKQKEHEDLLEKLQAQYDESEKALEAYSKSIKPRIKLLKRATPKPADGDEKEEL